MTRFIALAMLLTACGAPVQEIRSGTVPDDKDTNPTEFGRLLTTPEGCAVYRFYDGGHFVYFVVCPDSSRSRSLPARYREEVCQPAGKVTVCHSRTVSPIQVAYQSGDR